MTIFATDADKGPNGLIHYSIITPVNSTTFPFVIHPTAGVVTLRAALDYETTRSYRFLIRASDSGLPQSLFTDSWLSISIKDVNDCPVQILFVANQRFRYENQTLFIQENTDMNNVTLGYIRLVDRDSMPSKLRVSLLPLNENLKQNYGLVPSNQENSYTLIVKQGTFDRELQAEIHLHFAATDGLLVSNYDLTIHLIDVNDNPGEFRSNPLHFSVEELANYRMLERPMETDQLTLGYLDAVDRDEGENAISRYELEANAYVRVDANTGRLFLVQPFDREQISYVALRAKAINTAEPKWVTEVQIQIHV